MRDYFIYLCGGMGKFGKKKFAESNAWRLCCQMALESCECDYGVRVCNPNDYFNFVDDPPQYESQREVMNLNLNKLRSSDLVIANFNDMHSLGSMSEIAIAYDRGIPIIGLDVGNQELHPWQVCMCERVFNDIDKMIEYIKDFYLR